MHGVKVSVCCAVQMQFNCLQIGVTIFFSSSLIIGKESRIPLFVLFTVNLQQRPINWLLIMSNVTSADLQFDLFIWDWDRYQFLFYVSCFMVFKMSKSEQNVFVSPFLLFVPPFLFVFGLHLVILVLFCPEWTLSTKIYWEIIKKKALIGVLVKGQDEDERVWCCQCCYESYVLRKCVIETPLLCFVCSMAFWCFFFLKDLVIART